MSHENSQVQSPVNDHVLFIGFLPEAMSAEELAPLNMTVEELTAQMERGWAAIQAEGVDGEMCGISKDPDEAEAELREKGLPEADVQKLAPHKVIPGNRPSNTLVVERISPRRLGALVAMYEHKVFVQSVVWGINAFDQWGVELGKELATGLLPVVEGKESAAGHDSSTAGLVATLLKAAK